MPAFFRWVGTTAKYGLVYSTNHTNYNFCPYLIHINSMGVCRRDQLQDNVLVSEAVLITSTLKLSNGFLRVKSNDWNLRPAELILQKQIDITSFWWMIFKTRCAELNANHFTVKMLVFWCPNLLCKFAFLWQMSEPLTLLLQLNFSGK